MTTRIKMLKVEQTTIPTKIKRAEQKRCEKRKAVATIFKGFNLKKSTSLCFHLDFVIIWTCQILILIFKNISCQFFSMIIPIPIYFDNNNNPKAKRLTKPNS